MSDTREVLAAHAAVQDAQQAVRFAVTSRAEAIQQAMKDGVPVTEIAEALGVNRQRVYAMLKQ